MRNMGLFFGGFKNYALKMIIRIWTYSGFALMLCFMVYYVLGGIFAFILFILSFSGILYNAEDNFMYHPELPTHSRVFVPIPSMYNLPYENVYVRGSDGVLIHMFFIGQPLERRKECATIVFFHGNAGNMGHRLQNCVGLYYNLHTNVLMVEYRGYGQSDGYPSEEGLYIDARAALDYLYSRSDVNHSEIIVFGRSLGGAVAIDLASRTEYSDKIWCLIVENTFTSIPDMAKVLTGFKIWKYVPLFCYKNKFLSVHKVQHLRVPTLFVSGLADTLVPPRMMSELYSLCGSERKQLLQLPAGTHNETWTISGYYHSIAVFLHNCKLQKM